MSHLTKRMEDLRKTPSLAPTAAEYRAMLDALLAAEALVSLEREAARPRFFGDKFPVNEVASIPSARENLHAALARLAEAMR